ncbi:hypothetical protein [Gimesia fumaroli]|nr:hypothetical protein [Gimesia fumaroli]
MSEKFYQGTSQIFEEDTQIQLDSASGSINKALFPYHWLKRVRFLWLKTNSDFYQYGEPVDCWECLGYYTGLHTWLWVYRQMALLFDGISIVKSINAFLLFSILMAGLTSILLLSDEKPDEPISTQQIAEQPVLTPNVMPPKVTMCMYVQSAEITNEGILHFVTENSGGTRYYYFNAKDRNIVIVESAEIEADQIQIEDLEHGVLLITVPEALNLDIENFGKSNSNQNQ